LPQERLFFRQRPQEEKKNRVLWRKKKKKEDRITIQETLYILSFVWNRNPILDVDKIMEAS